jgi:hypothetical protein
VADEELRSGPEGEHRTTRADAGYPPTEPRRAVIESFVARIIATAGVIGIGTAVGAILDASNVTGWIIALVVSAVSVVLAAVLWRSRRF